MQPRIGLGLITGVILLVINAGYFAFAVSYPSENQSYEMTSAFSFLFFLCLGSPVLSLIAGGAAGLLSARLENRSTRKDGARSGVTAGGIAGALSLIGQIICAGLLLRSAGLDPRMFSPTLSCAWLGAAVLVALAGAGGGSIGIRNNSAGNQPPAASS